MSKAVLVLDMPEGCNDCVLNNCHFCDVTNENIESYMYDIMEVDKPDWCPLKELPHKRYHSAYGVPNEMSEDKIWNECISKILGENKDNK